MREERGRRGQGRGRLALAVVMGLVTLGLLVATGVLSWPHVKARVYERRIERGENPEGNLIALRDLEHPAAVPVLQRYALAPKVPGEESKALQILDVQYPESAFARGMADYRRITGDDYYCFGFYPYGSLDYLEKPPGDLEPELRRWLEAFPSHPGRDDAYLRLAAVVGLTRPVEALELLIRGHEEPDGDKRDLIANWFQRVLERHAGADELLAWTRAGCPRRLHRNVLYAAAVKRARERRFGEAVSLLEAALAANAAGAAPLQGQWAAVRGAALGGAMDKQLGAWRWFQAREAELATAPDDEHRAAVLHAMGRRCFREGQDAFDNLYYYPILIGREPEEAPQDGYSGRVARNLDDIHPSNRYRQAGDIFREIVLFYPGYSDLASVEYSIPLCLLRLRQASPARMHGLRLNAAIATGFQAFAAKYPRSTMADDALYLAGIHDYLATNYAEVKTIRANMARLAREYPHGDVVRRYGLVREEWIRNTWLHRAIQERVLEVAADVLTRAAAFARECGWGLPRLPGRNAKRSE